MRRYPIPEVGLVISPEQREAVYDLARKARQREEYVYHQTGKLLQGTDCAQAPLHGIVAKLWCRLAVGNNLEHCLTVAAEEWREYAAMNNRKVDSAPEIRNGPSSGHSVLAHRWVSPEAFVRDNAVQLLYDRDRTIVRLRAELSRLNKRGRSHLTLIRQLNKRLALGAEEENG